MAIQTNTTKTINRTSNALGKACDKTQKEIKKLTEEEFIRQCIDIHWEKESKAVRKKRLKMIYQRINGGGED